jgi:hypothetical protein
MARAVLRYMRRFRRVMAACGGLREGLCARERSGVSAPRGRARSGRQAAHRLSAWPGRLSAWPGVVPECVRYRWCELPPIEPRQDAAEQDRASLRVGRRGQRQSPRFAAATRCVVLRVSCCTLHARGRAPRFAATVRQAEAVARPSAHRMAVRESRPEGQAGLPEMGDGGARRSNSVLPSLASPLRVFRSFASCQRSYSSDLPCTGRGRKTQVAKQDVGAFLTHRSPLSLAAVETSQRTLRAGSLATEGARLSFSC